MEKTTDTTASVFARYQASPTGRMRYTLAQQNLSRLHDLTAPLNVLDAAGGNGLNTDWLLQKGHSVTLLDLDPEMLRQGRERLTRLNLVRRCSFVLGRIEEAARLLFPNRFNLVVCHHILEYLSDPPQALRALHEVAASGGELSLVTLNPVSEVIRAIVFRRDADLARSRLQDCRYDARWFGQARLFPFEQIVEWAKQSGWGLRDFRAIRVLADYVPDDAYDDAKEHKVAELENTLGGLEPYRRVGRYLQFCFDKTGD